MSDLKATKARLSKKADKGKLSKSERSLLGAVQLGLRFKGKEFKKTVKKAMRTGRIPR